MKKLIVFIFIFFVSGGPCAAKTLEEQQQTKRTVTIQTPFGPKEVDANSPEARALGIQMPVAVSPPAAAPPPADVAAQPQPQAGTAGAPQVADEPANVILRLDNQDIHAVIRIIGDTLGLSYVIDPAVKGTVNINTSDALRRSDLLPILETILKINGATMIKTGNFYQIVPANTAVRQSLQVEERGETVAPDDQMVMQIVRMRFVAAGEMSGLLTPYLTEGGNIVVHQAGNILMITERRSNLRKLLEIVDIFDTNAFEGERVRMFPIKNNLAKDLVSDLRTIFSGYAFSENATAIRFVPIDRLNSLLVVTPNSTVFSEVEKWLDRLDQPIPTAGIRNFIYRVQNAKAIDIQRILAELYGTRPQTPSSTRPSIGMAPDQAAVQQGSPFAVSPQAGGPSAQGTAAVQDGPVKIVADEINNALVVQTTPQLYPGVERTIRELDILPRQVLVDAQIFEVTLDDSLSLGLSAILQNRGTLQNPQTTASFVTPPGGVPSLTAQTFAFIGRMRELVGFLNASENRSRVRTLSAPSVLVSDNMTADFQVGAEVPIPTSSSVTPVQSGGTNLFAQTIQFRPTGVILKVRPQINASGNVTLEISQEVSQASTNTTSGVVAPVIGKSSVNSTVVIRDGQTIALSGFIREDNELARARVPLLGRIPGLGILFGNTRRASTRTELIVLITPHVLRTHEDADLATDELKKKLKEVKKLLK